MRQFFLFSIILLLIVPSSFSQPAFRPAGVVPNGPRLKLECDHCDYDFLKRKLEFVNFVRDVRSADIYVKVTSQTTGTGTRHKVYFEGQKEFAGFNDTLIISSESDDTAMETNDLFLRTFRLGLLPYLIRTPLLEKIEYTVTNGPMEEEVDQASQIDPWNSWVFSVNGNINFNRESNYNGLWLRMGAHASRKTDYSKWNFSYNNQYSESNFYFRDENDQLIDSLSIHSYQKNQNFWAAYVFSLSEHWSLAFNGSAWENTFSNYRPSGRLEAGVEYNIYPYGESDRRMFVFTWQLGGGYNDYVEPTIYEKSEEWLATQRFEAFLSQNQKWGFLAVSAQYMSYFHDLDLSRISIEPSINWNIFKGFTLGVGSDISYVNNQINLPKGEADISNVLLRDKLLATNFEWRGHMSVRYSFGSEFANAVNPRFWGRGG